MAFHDCHFKWLSGDEAIFLIGIATGRVNYEPEAKWLYSLRIFLGLFRIEVLWQTGTAFETNDQAFDITL
jgi:hypothetical protein